MIANYKNVIRDWLHRSCPVNWSSEGFRAAAAQLRAICGGWAVYPIELSAVQRNRLQSVLKLIEGFESTYALELLASVDYASKQPGVDNVEQVIYAIKQWNPRKADLFQSEHVKLAYDHLEAFRSAVFS